MRLRSILPLAVAALAFGLWGSQPAAAEDDRGVAAVVNGTGTYNYRIFDYPSRVAGFFLYPQSYVTFDVANGKYFEIESNRAEFWNNFPRTGLADVFPWTDKRNALHPEMITVSFYTPDMRLLGSTENIRMNRRYSVPRDGNNYERIVVKLESAGKENWDVKMRIWDPVDPVIAEPIPHQIYHR
jgi:hypothetical protein